MNASLDGVAVQATQATLRLTATSIQLDVTLAGTVAVSLGDTLMLGEYSAQVSSWQKTHEETRLRAEVVRAAPSVTEYPIAPVVATMPGRQRYEFRPELDVGSRFQAGPAFVEVTHYQHARGYGFTEVAYG